MPYANICSRPGTVIDSGDKPLEEAQANADIVPGVRLQWGRDQSEVQLAVLPMTWGSDGSHSSPMVNPDDPRAQEQTWSRLGRYEINQLIKKLREARDQACGRDE